jgi:hypothetical protein
LLSPKQKENLNKTVRNGIFKIAGRKVTPKHPVNRSLKQGPQSLPQIDSPIKEAGFL